MSESMSSEHECEQERSERTEALTGDQLDLIREFSPIDSRFAQEEPEQEPPSHLDIALCDILSVNESALDDQEESEGEAVLRRAPYRVRKKLPSWLGDLEHLEPYSAVICSDHADELRQHFRLGGIDAFGKSTFAGMLARAELYAGGTKPCLRCGGYIPLEPDDPRPEQAGCGFISSRSTRNKAVTAKQSEFLALLGIEVAASIPAADIECPDCGCHGWIQTRAHATEAITARPTGSSVHHEPMAPSMDLNLQILAVCSRRLERADTLFPGASIVLAGHFEPGAHGLLSLWWLVPAGKTWLRQNSLGLQPSSFFLAQRVAQEKNKNQKVEKVMRSCDEQAAALLEAAGMAWNAALEVEQREVPR